MMGSFLTSVSAPVMQMLFPPVPLIEQIHRTPELIFGVLEYSLAAAFLALWRAARDYRVFSTLGFFYTFVGTDQFLQYVGGTSPPMWSLNALAVALLVEVAGKAMQISRRRWTRLLWPVYFFAAVGTWFPSMAWVNDLPLICSEPVLGILIVQGFRRGNRRDRIVAAAFAFHFFVRLTLSLNFQHLTGMKNYFTIGGWQWQYTTCGITALGAVTLAILVRDLIHDRAEKQRLAAELAASRAVQQVLMPEKTPEVAGFTIRSVYKPFGEVGGDFYQILPLADGGVLIVIGDVSGKGMPAAMTVSLVVGALCLAVRTTTKPGEILEALNHALLGRNRDGFTTCLVIRADADGTLIMANAGHLAPYIDGQELLLDNGLPLGLAADSNYAESSFHLAAGQHILLLTDGVIEARNQTGELFGFEHTAAIAGQSAESIAIAAQAFGQEDDITVLTLQRTVPA